MSTARGAIKEFVGRIVNDRELMEEGHMERYGEPGHARTDGERVEQVLGDALADSRRTHAARRFGRGSFRRHE